MALTAIGLCGRALIKLGAIAIASFEDGSAEAEVAAALYGPTRDALLSANAWSFASVQAALPRLAEPPVADYACAFQLPADFLRALAAGGRAACPTASMAGRCSAMPAQSPCPTSAARRRRSFPPSSTRR